MESDLNKRAEQYLGAGVFIRADLQTTQDLVVVMRDLLTRIKQLESALVALEAEYYEVNGNPSLPVARLIKQALKENK